MLQELNVTYILLYTYLFKASYKLVNIIDSVFFTRIYNKLCIFMVNILFYNLIKKYLETKGNICMPIVNSNVLRE